MSTYERDINRSMYNYMPRYYEDIKEAREIIDTESDAFKQIKNDARDVLNQFYIDTATWGLAKWERLLGDPNAGNYDKTTFQSIEENLVTFGQAEGVSFTDLEVRYPVAVEQRRANIKAKIRGCGTVTKALIKNVAESYVGGEVDVIEDSANYTIIIKFISTYGVPTQIEDVEKVLREIIPAHLDLKFDYLYITYNTLATQYATYDELSSAGLTYGQILTNGE